jgi:hypothetical protein
VKFNISKIATLAAAAAVVAACSTGGASGNGSGGSSGGNSTDNLNTSAPFTTTVEVLDAVKAAQNLTTVPDSVAAGLAREDNDPPKPYFDCKTVPAADNPTDANPFGQCAWGDPKGSKLMVIYGDSHAPMWHTALAAVGAKQGWKVRAFSLGGCPVPDLQFWSYQSNAPYTKCDEFRASVIPAIKAMHPDLLIMTSISDQLLADQSRPTPEQWQDGWASTFNKLSQPGTKYAILGDIPVWKNNDARCLAAHLKAVQDCSAPIATATPKNIPAEQAAAERIGALYIPTVPWICAETCQPVIASIRVFNNQYHLTRSYVLYLAGAVSEALRPVMT